MLVAIRNEFDSDDWISILPGAWLVHTKMSTSRAVWERIVGHLPEQPTGIAFAIRGNYGYHNMTVWEWLAAKRTADNGD